MSDDNYLDIFDDESVRVTTFRRLELPERISDIHGESIFSDLVVSFRFQKCDKMPCFLRTKLPG